MRKVLLSLVSALFLLPSPSTEVREPVPLTRDNFETYHGGLLERAHRYLELSVRQESR